MAIEYVGGVAVGRNGNANATTTQSLTGLTGGIASAPAEGDLVIVCCASGSQGRNPSAAISGYSTLGTQLNATAVTYDTSMQVSYKRMTATPDTSITIPAQGNVADGQAWAVMVFRGVDASTPFDPSSVSATGTATGRPDPAAITPANSGAWVVIGAAAAAAATTTAFTAPTDFATNFVQATGADTNDARASMGYYTGWTSGSYDPAQFTGGTTGANDSWAAWTMALKPAPTPVNLDGTGTALALSGGTATLTATATHSFDVPTFALASTKYAPTVSVAAPATELIGTGSALALTGGTATLEYTANVALDATGTALALSGGTATLSATDNKTLDATGVSLALTGGNATLSDTQNVWLVATGSQSTLTGGTADLTDTRNIWLTATGSQISLAGGNATLDAGQGVSLDGTGSALALSGGAATLEYTANVSLTATGSQLTFTGGTAALTAGGNTALVGSGSQVALSGGNATLSFTDNLSLDGTGSALALSGGNATLSATDNKSLDGTGTALALTGGNATLVAQTDIDLVATGASLSLVGGNASLEVGAPAESGGGGGFVRVSKEDREKFKNWLLRPVSFNGKPGKITLKGGSGKFSLTEIRSPFKPNPDVFRPVLRLSPQKKAVYAAKKARPSQTPEQIAAKAEAARIAARRKRDEEFLLFIA